MSVSTCQHGPPVMLKGRKQRNPLFVAVNRRMDEWTTLDHVDLTTVTTSEAELAAVVTESGGRTRNQKRKSDEMHEEEEHHAEFDQNALREHEEFTKVKNVERIELGRYEMETWYFSPLPQEYNMCKVHHICLALYCCVMSNMFGGIVQNVLYSLVLIGL